MSGHKHSHQDCFESPDPEVDFEQLNEKMASSTFHYKEPAEISVYKTRPTIPQETETHEERFARLRAELGELREDVEFLAEKEKLFNAGNEELDMLKEIHRLEEEMMEVAKIKGVDSILSSSFHGQANFEQHLRFMEGQKQGKVLEEIFGKIDNFSRKHEEESKSNNTDNLKVELLVPQREEDLMSLKKFKELESRIDFMEKTVGVGKDFQIEGNIVNKIEELFKLASGLNPQRLELNARKIQVINSELDQILRKNNELVNQDNDFKNIQELYEKFLKTQKIASELPEIVEKLECLKYMHDNSGKTGAEIGTLKENEKTIRSKLEENQVMIEKVEGLFVNSLQGLMEKMKGIEEKAANYLKK